MPKAVLYLLIFLIAIGEGAWSVAALWVSGAAAILTALCRGGRFGVIAVPLIFAGYVLSGVPVNAALWQSIAVAGAMLVAMRYGGSWQGWTEDWRLQVRRALGTILVPSAVAGLMLLVFLSPSEALWRAVALATALACFAPAVCLAGERVHAGTVASAVLSGAVVASAVALQMSWFANLVGITTIALIGAILTAPVVFWSLAGMALGANVAQLALSADGSEPLSLTLLLMSLVAVVICTQVSKLRGALLDSQDMARRRTARIRYLLQDRDEVTALAVHDLQSPIQAIGGMQKTLLHMIETGLTDPDQIRPALEVAIETSSDLSDRVASVLNEKRPHLGGRGDGALAGVIINHTVAAHRLELDEKALQITRINPTDSVVDHAEDVKDVLDVLLDNAIRHSPSGGAIVVSFGLDDLSNALKFEVSDEGPGVGEKDAERLFKAPVRSDERDRQGMGLFLAYRRARSLGGSLAYRPSAGGGACFVLVLPQPA